MLTSYSFKLYNRTSNTTHSPACVINHVTKDLDTLHDFSDVYKFMNYCKIYKDCTKSCASVSLCFNNTIMFSRILFHSCINDFEQVLLQLVQHGRLDCKWHMWTHLTALGEVQIPFIHCS